MEFRHLRYFVAVAEELNITAAAAKLRLAQPSLTRQIKNLEEELHVQLFHREKNKISLTESGRFFFERTKRLLAQSAFYVQELRRHDRGENGSLNIGYVADMHHNLLPKTLGTFRKVWADVALNLFDLTVAEQFKALEEEKIDLCFVGEARLPVHAGLQSEVIMLCEMMAVVPETSPLAGIRRLQLKALKSMPFITMDEAFYPGASEWLLRVCRTAGFTPKIAYEVDRSTTMISLVSLELGVALLPEPCLQLPHDGAVFRPLACRPKIQTKIVWKKKNLSQALSHYIQIVRKQFASGRSSEGVDV